MSRKEKCAWVLTKYPGFEEVEASVIEKSIDRFEMERMIHSSREFESFETKDFPVKAPGGSVASFTGTGLKNRNLVVHGFRDDIVAISQHGFEKGHALAEIVNPHPIQMQNNKFLTILVPASL